MEAPFLPLHSPIVHFSFQFFFLFAPCNKLNMATGAVAKQNLHIPTMVRFKLNSTNGNGVIGAQLLPFICFNMN